MMPFDPAALRVLVIGGTGTISASCVRLAVATGVLSRIVDAYQRARTVFESAG